MIRKVAILANGGDVSGFNAVIRAIVKTAENNGIDCYGFIDGYNGLLKNNYEKLSTANDEHASGILQKGGSIIGSSTNANVFHYKVEENGETVYKDLSDVCVENIKKDGFDCLFTLGGDGTQKSARDFATKGVNVVAPTWFETSDNDGNVTSLASDSYVQTAHQAGVQVWALCSDFGPKMKIGKVLGTTSKRQKLVKNLIAEAIRYDLDGINIDFENVKKDSGEDFIQFVRELGIMCRNNGVVLSIDNYPPAGGISAYYNRKEQAEVADYVITMSYDEHYAGSKEAGPVSSISYVTNSIQEVGEEVPAEQMVIALPFYSRHWKEKTKGGKAKLSSEACSMKGAQTVLKDSGKKATWDDATGMNYVEYTESGTVHKIWIEDAKSLELKMKAVSDANLGGVAFWKLGLEDASVWNMIEKYVKH